MKGGGAEKNFLFLSFSKVFTFFPPRSSPSLQKKEGRKVKNTRGGPPSPLGFLPPSAVGEKGGEGESTTVLRGRGRNPPEQFRLPRWIHKERRRRGRGADLKVPPDLRGKKWRRGRAHFSFRAFFIHGVPNAKKKERKGRGLCGTLALNYRNSSVYTVARGGKLVFVCFFPTSPPPSLPQ